MPPSSTLAVRVYYEDTDAGGIVYHANYLKYFERARTEYLRACGLEQDDLLAAGLAFVVSQCRLDFLAPARFNAQLTVHSHIAACKRASLQFAQRIVAADGRELVTAQVQIVCVRHPDLKPVAMPAHIKGALLSAR
ncbi:MAG: tol-pal system-associated acyl-CoA thioesterase [Aeromonas sp.]